MERTLTALRAAGEPTRLRILTILSAGELTVSELTQVLSQSQPRISRHLKLLADAGLVQRHPEGSWVFYRLKEDGKLDFLEHLIGALPSDDLTLQRDRERLAQVRETRATRAQAYFRANAENWDALRAQHIPETVVEQKLAALISQQKIDLLVDLGTGTGRILELFGARAAHAVGFDISPDMLALARTKLDELGLHHCQVRQGDCANVPLEDGVADIVVLHQVLHFLDDPQQSIIEAARILRPNGRVVIVDFAPHDMEILRESHAHRRLGFASAEMCAWLKQAGLNFCSDETLPAQSGQLAVAFWLASKSGQKDGVGL